MSTAPPAEDVGVPNATGLGLTIPSCGHPQREEMH